MESFLKCFLAKNKYPEVQHQLETLETDFDNLPMEEANSDSNASLILTLQNLGIGNKENLDKAEHWALQMSPELSSLCLLVITYLRLSPLGYATFKTNYELIISKSQAIEADDHEYLYRFLRLLSGLAQLHHEPALAQDLWQLSEWVETPTIDPLQVDQLINRWLAQGRHQDLILINWVIPDHEKLNYYLENPTTKIIKQ